MAAHSSVNGLMLLPRHLRTLMPWRFSTSRSGSPSVSPCCSIANREGACGHADVSCPGSALWVFWGDLLQRGSSTVAQQLRDRLYAMLAGSWQPLEKRLQELLEG